MFCYSGTKNKNLPLPNNPTKTRNQALPKDLFPKNLLWISVLPASVQTWLLSSLVQKPLKQQIIPSQDEDKEAEERDKSQVSSRLPEKEALSLFHAQNTRLAANLKYLVLNLELIDKLKNGLVGENKSGIEDVDEEEDFDFDYDDDF